MFDLIYLSTLKKIVDDAIADGYGDIPVMSSYFVKVQNSTIFIVGNSYGTVTGTVIGGFPVKTITETEPSIFELVLEYGSSKFSTLNDIKQIIDKGIENNARDCIVCTLDQYNEDESYWLLERAEIAKYKQFDKSMFLLYFSEVL